jgi:hypothetical protein
VTKPQGVSDALWDKCVKRAVRYCAKYMVEAGQKPLNREDALRSVGRSIRLDLTTKKKV